MNSPQKIISDLDFSTTQIEQILSDLDNPKFNQIPVNDEWSIAGVIEHLVKIETALYHVLIGKNERTLYRPADQKVEEIRTVFLNFEHKLKAGDPIQPTGELNEKEESLKKFKMNRDAITNRINPMDLSETCLDYNHSIFGLLTRYEWCYFIIYHTERHMNQIERIKSIISI